MTASLFTWMFDLPDGPYVVTTAPHKGAAVAHAVHNGKVDEQSKVVAVTTTITSRREAVLCSDGRVFHTTTHKRRPPGTFHPEVGYLAHDEADAEEIRSGLFAAADEKEWTSIHDNGVMVEQELPKGSHAIRCRWRRTWKELPGGGRKAKSRFLVCATNDPRDVETSTHMPSPAVRRSLIVYGLSRGWTAATIDIQTAFLLVPLPKEHGDVYVRLPPYMPECATSLGYKSGGVYKLQKSLYGLKESPLLFNQYLEKVLTP